MMTVLLRTPFVARLHGLRVGSAGYTLTYPMAIPCIVLIAAADCLGGVKAKVATECEIVTFFDTEPLRAFETIAKRRPAAVILERRFAATPRGVALINRLKADPALAETEIRVVSHDTNYSRVLTRTAASLPQTPVRTSEDKPAPAPALDRTGTRVAKRFKIKPGREVQLDGNPATLIDLSISGAQLLSGVALRPSQRVRMTLADDHVAARIAATVAWATFELPRGTAPPHYRIGVEFNDVDTAAVDSFLVRHKK